MFYVHNGHHWFFSGVLWKWKNERRCLLQLLYGIVVMCEIGDRSAWCMRMSTDLPVVRRSHFLLHLVQSQYHTSPA